MANPNPKPIENELVELENQYWQALRDSDVETCVRLTEDPCIVTGAQGVGRIDREQLVQMMQTATYTLRNFDVRDVQVERLGDDVAVIAYKVHEELMVDGEPVAFDAADTSTWVRRDGHWKCAAHSEALAGDPFGRDRTPH